MRRLLPAGLTASLVAAVVAGACSSASGSGPGAGGYGAAGASDASGGAAGSAAGGVGGAGGEAGSFVPDETITVIGEGADQSSPGKFGGGDDSAAKPEIVYPPDGVLVPPNLNSLEIHWKPAAGQTLFEISFDAPPMQYVAYVGCDSVGGGCVFSTEQQFWEKLVGAAKGGAPLAWRVRGVDGAAPGAVGTSAEQTIAFVNEPINGGLYYWNDVGVIQRYDFGYPLKASELYMTVVEAGAVACVGCHALSRNGKRMAVGSFIPAPAPYKVFDVATKQVVTSSSGQPIEGFASFYAFSPDGNQLLYSDGLKIGWRDTTTGAIVNDNLIPSGTMPDWAPNGGQMVYAKPGVPQPVAAPTVQSGSLELVEFSGGQWGTPTELVPFQGENNYYPAFAPSQDWIVFNRSPSNTDSFSNAPPAGDGELWAVETDTGKQVRLDAASEGGSCSWPKWAPDLASYWDGNVMWFTFTSARQYGLRLSKGQKAQLWMTAFDPKRAGAGEDGSFPAIWFPYQDIASGNHIAQWVTKVERQPCTEDFECPSGYYCVGGVCVPIIK